jgi:drug/metabolite transporter (DMT)-like permease
MSITQTLLVLLSVLMVCAGQLLFKLVGLRLNAGLALFDSKVWTVAILSMVIYGSATVLWIAVLRTVPLVKAYPYMALSFVLVPLGSIFFYSEKVQWTYAIGAALIVVGVMLTTLQPRV